MTFKTTAYARGRSFEYRVRDDLQSEGYFVARIPVSRSPLDLLAVKRGTVLFVQCKVNGRLDPEEWNDLYALAETHGAVPILAERERRKINYDRLMGPKTGRSRAGGLRGAYNVGGA